MWHSLWSYHPRIGYTYTPGVKTRVPFENGGYLVRTNAAGFRCDHDFVKERTPGRYRALLFGDSQTAGDGVSNGERYGDLLEGAVPRLEVFNYGLTGSGVDQHYLVYLECADVEHDLLVIAVHVENIGRVAHRFLEFLDADGNEVLYAKPYYEVDGGQLVLHHIPVPRVPFTKQTIASYEVPHVDRGVPHPRLRALMKKLGMRDLMQKVTRFQPVPDYGSSDNPNWLLLRRILETWIRGSPAPVLLVPIPMWPFVEGSSDPAAYQARFRELAADTGCHLHDPLADLRIHGPEERRTFRFGRDTHLSRRGHQAVAQSIAPVIRRIVQESSVTAKGKGEGVVAPHRAGPGERGCAS
jgi:hypothetical protein